MKAKSFGLHPLAAAALSALLASCASVPPPQQVTQGVVLRNVTVVGTSDGRLAPAQAVVIEGARIVRVLDDAAVRIGGNARVIDGAGRFLVPGYNDMHAHALADADQQPPAWPLMIANGITGMRQMAGSAALIQRAKQLNADSAAGRIDAPEILQSTGDLVVGVTTAEAARNFVRVQKSIGSDLIKIVAGSREVVLATLAEAQAQGLPVAGHLSPGVPALESAAAGWRSIEHFGAGTGLLLDCSRDEAAIRRSLLNGEGAKPVPFGPATVLLPMLDRELDAPFYQRILDTVDAAKCEGIARQLVRDGVWQVPTLIRLRTMLLAADPAYVNDPNLVYVEPKRRSLWQGLGRRFAAMNPPSAAETFGRYYEGVTKLVLLMQQSGAKLLAGSDQGGVWVVPGFGLHQEFRELAKAGLTPLQVLQATTVNAAAFLGREATMGRVAAGREADLVLLDANPLADVANLARISGVVLNGKVFDAAALAKMKADVAAAYRN